MNLFNATAILMRPLATASSVDQQRQHRFEDLDEQRCSFRALSAVRSIGPLGRVSLKAYTLRLQSSEQIKPGWRVKVKLDGDGAEWDEYVVAAASKAAHWNLTVEGAG